MEMPPMLFTCLIQVKINTNQLKIIQSHCLILLLRGYDLTCLLPTCDGVFRFESFVYFVLLNRWMCLGLNH